MTQQQKLGVCRRQVPFCGAVGCVLLVALFFNPHSMAQAPGSSIWAMEVCHKANVLPPVSGQAGTVSTRQNCVSIILAVRMVTDGGWLNLNPYFGATPEGDHACACECPHRHFPYPTSVRHLATQGKIGSSFALPVLPLTGNSWDGLQHTFVTTRTDFPTPLWWITTVILRV